MADRVAFLAGKRGLVVEDEFLIALDIQQVLETAGAGDILCTGNAADALAILDKDSAFDFAVLDIKLAGRADNSTAIAARLAERGVPFVFLTGMRAHDIRAGAFSGVPVVEKPYQAAVLIDAIRRALTGA